MEGRSLRSYKTSLNFRNNTPDPKGNIQVVCRFRPLNQTELTESVISPVKFLSSTSVSIKNQYSDTVPLIFSYDKIFPPTSSQQEVYESAALPIIESVLEGFNGSILAYGQTSSGKTYTMTGGNILDTNSKGIIPRLSNTIFEYIEKADPNIEFSVKVGFFEIYLEKIRDLLVPQKHLKIVEDKNRGVYVRELTEEYVINEKELLYLIKAGNLNKEVASTLMNENSSRSHSILLLTITQADASNLSSKTGKLYMVDLAGSEKVTKSGVEGKRLDEAKNINKSLSALGLVINSLTDNKSTHIPYRDSKLTRILQDSLGGNSKTCLIITCSPASLNETETISTLRFGARAKMIKNKAKINKDFSVLELKQLLTQANEKILQKEIKIQELENILKTQNFPYDYQGVNSSSPIWQELQNERLRLQKEIENSSNLDRALKDQIAKFDRIFKENSNLNMKMMSLLVTMQDIEEKLQDSHEENRRTKKILEVQNLKISELEDVIRTQELIIMEQNKHLEKFPLEYSQVADKDIEDFKDSQDLLKIKEDSIRTNYTQIFDESTDYQGSLMQDSRMTQSFTLDLTDISSMQRKSKWKTQKKSLLADIEQKNLIIEQLKFETIDSKLHQRELERLRLENDKRLKQKVMNLEKELSELNNSYEEIGAKLQIKSKKQEKIRKFNERVQKLERFMKDQSEKLSTIEEEDSYYNKKHHSRLKKSIKGGQSGDSRFSSVLGVFEP